MALKHNSELRVMRTLTRNWHKHFSAYELSELSGVNVQSVYNAMAKLDKQGMLSKVGPKVSIRLGHPYAWSFKLLADSERLLRLPKKVQENILDIYRIYRDTYGQNLYAAMLIGSAATDEMTEESDIDMLFIVSKRKDFDFGAKRLFSKGELNLVERTRKQFEQEYLHGNDFMLAALRDGVLLADNYVLKPFFQKPLPPPSEETLLRREEYLERLRRRMFREQKIGDSEALVKAYKQFLIEITRVELLKKGQLPGTKQAIIGKMPKKRRKSYYSVTSGIVAKEVRNHV